MFNHVNLNPRPLVVPFDEKSCCRSLVGTSGRAYDLGSKDGGGGDYLRLIRGYFHGRVYRVGLGRYWGAHEFNYRTTITSFQWSVLVGFVRCAAQP